EDERDTDAEQAEHEGPVDDGVARQRLEGPGERALGAEAEEPLGGAAPVEPGRSALGREAQAEGLVEEGPEEDPAEADPQRGADVAGGAGGAGLGSDDLGVDEVRVRQRDVAVATGCGGAAHDTLP